MNASKLNFRNNEWTKFNKTYLRRSLKRLEKQKLVAIREDEEKATIRITKYGRQKILKYALDNFGIEKSKTWDGKIKIYYQGNQIKIKELKYKILMRNPKAEIINAKSLNIKIDNIKRKQQMLNATLKPKWKQAQNHPWRQYVYAN